MKRRIHVEGFEISSTVARGLLGLHNLRAGPGPHDPAWGLCVLVDKSDLDRGGVLCDLQTEHAPDGWDLSNRDIEIIPVELALDDIRCRIQKTTRKTALAGRQAGAGLALVAGGAR